MTAHAILEVADAFLEMLRLNLRRIVLVAAIASVGFVVRRGMASRARNVAATAMIKRERVFESRTLPRFRGVALRTIRAERA